MGYGTLMFVEVRCVLFRLLCRVEEGSDQLGYVHLCYVMLRQFSRGWVFLGQLGSVEAVELWCCSFGSVKAVEFY